MSTNYNYDDEPTQYGSEKKSEKKENEPRREFDDEATQFDNASGSSDINQQLDEPQLDKPATVKAATPKRKKKGSSAAGIAAAAGAGILLGTGAVFLTSFIPHHDNSGDAGSQASDWNDGKVPVATKVNDDMSYAEAFTAAREEVGAGGVFTWHGNVYGTYYQTEWDNMSDAERAEFNGHFDWDKLDNNEHDQASNGHETNNNDDAEVVAHVDHSSSHHDTHSSGDASHHAAHAAPTHHDSDDVDVVNVNGGGSEHHGQGSVTHDNVDPGDVEILGVTHDDESGMNIAAVRVDGNDAVLVDVDNDNVFDVLATDANHDGQLQENEMVDISSEHLTTQDLGGVQPSSTTDYDGGLANTDVEPDYVDDGANS